VREQEQPLLHLQENGLCGCRWTIVSSRSFINSGAALRRDVIEWESMYTWRRASKSCRQPDPDSRARGQKHR